MAPIRLLRQAASLVFALALPAMAQADAVLEQVEEHCIQPGLETAHFLTIPKGWSALPADVLPDALIHAAIPNALYAATVQYKKLADDTAYDAKVREELADEIEDNREDMADGEIVFMQHPSGAKLMVKIGNGGWSFLECMLWHPNPDAALNRKIVARWSVAAPLNLQTPYGFRNDTSVYISMNSQPAELNADIIRPTSKLVPTSLILVLETRPI